MKKILVDVCAPENIFRMMDADAPNETEFEATTVRALACVYPNYRCIVFGGGFRYDDAVSRPDLALVARDLSHWFVIEVELLSHSLERHVLPQVRAFQYGEPLPDCADVLARELSMTDGRARTLVERVPRAVAVVANGRRQDWELCLRGVQVQYLALTTYRTPGGREAFEIDGELEVIRESLGFGVYSAADRALRFVRTVNLPDGLVQLESPRGGAGLWKVSRDDRFAWVTKEVGRPELSDATHIQLIRTVDGRITLRGPDDGPAR